MWETYGPFQGNPETYTYANFWKMVQTNAYFAKMFTGKKIKKED